MKSLFSKKAKTIIGLDIGTKYIKALSLDVSSSSTKVLSYACEPIMGKAFAEREIKDFDAISKALKKVKLVLAERDKHCALAVAGSSVLSKLVFMEANQSDFELESQIELEADSLIPYPLSEVYVDFEELRASESQDGKIEVLLSVAHRDLVDTRMTVVRENLFEPKIIDLESNALGEAFMQYIQDPIAPDEVVCCVNVGASLLQLSVVQNKHVIYTKEHAYGLNKLNQDLSLIYDLEMQEVELRIHNSTAPEDWLAETLPSFYASLQQQIQRAIQMYTSATHKPPPTKIYLCGGVTNLPNVCEELDKELSIQVLPFNPFSGMEISSNINAEKLLSIAPQMTIALGLATRKLESWQR
ncbi:type IV pilus assembly protein PilM [Glaciecola punicea ACAM 611]|jgi:type IV pilus assembly protein PilM|uniref:Type IV pilus assembly protein PilM n=1 Tax=Glaciecola punicea ACAM 611 TaxID=1121923 RepID=H5TF04_9ALTE|nr:type IV pilus assembly protein PilM [Glaciecola punicea]GAB56931.1 type IV pilus assembly protein PilM [Glaciecola punicea ACAM 611]